MFFKVSKEGRHEWWLYLAGVFFVLMGYTLGQMPLKYALEAAASADPNLDESDVLAFASDPDFAKFGIDLNFGFFLLLLMFVGASIVLWILVVHFHRREWKTVITAKPKINFNKILFGFALWFGFGICSEIAMYAFNPEDYIFNLNWKSFVPLLIICLTLLPIQSSFEEVFFRGYLMQGIGRISRHKWVPLLISSLLFGLIHSANPEIEKFGFWIMQFYYMGAGLLLGLLVIMDDGLELALGFHAATNMYSALIIGYEGAAIQTETLFKTVEYNATLKLVVFLIFAVSYYLICARRYEWPSIKKIFDPIRLDYDETV